MIASAPASQSEATRRYHLVIEGLVQGLGVRPRLYRLATRLGLRGSLRNDPRGVVVDVEGRAAAVEAFLASLGAELGGAARPARIEVVEAAPRLDCDDFRIEQTAWVGPRTVHPAPDLALCEACRQDLDRPGDRRQNYALVTCTACGPRFTIALDLPWAREATTLARFVPCPACRAEFEDPADRRFHAEGIACPACGPRLALHDGSGRVVDAADPVETAAVALRAGGVVAVKGVGGYHLACDATDERAVRRLRERKRREGKPFAIMLADLPAVRRACWTSSVEERLLTSPARPIVLLARRRDARPAIAEAVAPGRRELGVLLPYTPLHVLLLRAAGLPLVMTSGNPSGEPIVGDDETARRRLGDTADLFLGHDRPIAATCDDSVVRVVRGRALPVRRARGWVPLPVALPVTAPRPILACGGDLKAVFALARGGEAFLSQHLGDLGEERAWRAWREALAHFRRLLRLEPEVVVHDLHPGYRTTAFARSLDGPTCLAVQHHHAHVAACLADNATDGPVIGVAWDGTGYGPDGSVWGGEFLLADLAGFRRVAHLEEVPLPGGDAAVREPWRMAGAYLLQAFGTAWPEALAAGADGLDVAQRLRAFGWPVLARALAASPMPRTTSAGRLFDAVASLLGLRDRVDYEAQAAVELEALAAPHADRTYEVTLGEGGDRLVVRSTDLIHAVVDDLRAGVPREVIAARFHAALAEIIARVADRIRAASGVGRVALTGGVFQNARLLRLAAAALEARGFQVLRHQQVPPNDGGLALGQAAVAARWLAGGGG
jgi:hydrogenase maturation protein HypF